MNIRTELDKRISAALTDGGAPEGTPAIINLSSRPEADYQANGCMAAAKKLGTNPRELADKVVKALDLSDLAESVDVAGPGFINIKLDDEFLAARANEMAADDRFGLPTPAEPQTVVVDYSSPNLAKEMHVGHLRSTIIGDALARVLEFQGHNVIRQNHVGDWGTQFGMLVEHMIDEHMGWLVRDGHRIIIEDLEEFYREAKQKFDASEEFADRSRQRVVMLQAGDAESLRFWQAFRKESLKHCHDVYERLGVLLTQDDMRGESAYNDDLPKVVADLDAAGMLAESEGAKGVYLDEFTNKDNERAFVIVVKSGGGYLYATTDLAALRFRAGKGKEEGVVDWVADRVLYVTDSRQAEHFDKVFLIARKAGFVPEAISLEHVGFGMMLGENKRPFATREGGTVKLMDLINEAERRAKELVAAKAEERGEEMSEAELDEIAHKVGIGSLKYADLAQNRTSDYVFSWEKMLSFEGNTAPYMQYAYARIRSIFAKGAAKPEGEDGSTDFADSTDMFVGHPAERSLMLMLSRFAETVQTVADTCQPHVLCAYLYDLAGAFMGLYENCPVLKAEGATRDSRLALCKLTADVIQRGLGLLGIDTVERM
ncbi:MAG: arginine--tRNA ligase [Planctomycetes bacterium]|jgi:arginyl-tRNA synthetase|nr:arginine--tRNA ligase [Planctomycetota bacterium]